MALPRKLKNFNLSIDSVSYLGEAVETTLPKLAMKLEDYQSGGMFAPVAVNMGLEKLELEFKMGGNEPNLIKLFGGTINGTAIRFNGAYQRDDTEEVDAVEIICEGRVSEVDRGNQKAGDDTEHAYKVALTYYKEIVNNEEIAEIDTLNQIFKVGGKDRLAEVRKALGL
ncbi:phage major tail tube protein [Actinobacillus lignieresii]|uniref:Phage major tail tube protein n=1 Tax=Actinobacillus lignieresii TaxID=720 RepID=A0A380TT15_ACTLI|nr:phage major tail tube protein [Actinobacillus lignieresii]SUT91518.1 phage major tail tube protein [Actinobacillus lignieresii]VEB25893.1 phage major tail tube protein [Actinobacillus lignieresii]